MVIWIFQDLLKNQNNRKEIITLSKPEEKIDEVIYL